MQQLDDLEIWKVLQDPPSEETMRDVNEGNQSPESPQEVDGPCLLSSEGSSGAKSILEPSPALPQRPRSAQVEEDLPNGEVQDGDLFGNEHSPEDGRAQWIPVAAEKGGHGSHPGGSEAASTVNTAGPSLDPSKAPASRQRKLAMEEMVIRDHLGQEVGCMDAVRQNQSSLEKEEEMEEHANFEGRCDSGSQPGPVDGVLDHKEALGEGPLDSELGSRDGPEGESPTSQDHLSPLGPLQSESGCLKGQGDGPWELGCLAKESDVEGVGQKAVPEQSAQEMEPALAPATGGAPTTASVKQSPGSQMESPKGQESGATAEGQGDQRPGSPLEQLSSSVPHVQEMKDLSSQEEAKMPLPDVVLPSSPTQILVMPQDTVPYQPGMNEPLLDQIPFQENEGSLQDPELSFLSEQNPLSPLGQNSSLPESKGSLLDPGPYSMQECLSDQNPLSLQDTLSSSLEIKPSNLHQELPCLPDVEHSVMDQDPSSLKEADGTLSSWSQMRTGIQTAPLLDQPISPLPEDEPLALQHIPSSWHEMEKPITQQGQEHLRHESEGSLPDKIPSETDQLSSLLEQTVSLPDTKTPAWEDSPVAPQDQLPTPPVPQISPLPEADVFLLSPIPPSGDSPCESPTALLDQIPPVLQKTELTALMGRTPPSSLQEDDGALPDDIQTPLPNHPVPDLPQAEGCSPVQAAPASGDQTAASLLVQTPSSQEGQNSSDPPEGSSNVAEQISPPDKARSPVSQDTPVCPNALPLSSQEVLQPLLDKSKAEEVQDAKGSGNASVASAGAGEATEVLGNLHAEKQPLLKEAKVSGDIAAGDLQSKVGILKSQVATSNQTPNNSGTRTSANTAYSHQLQAALPRQGEDREPEKGKRKSCQCCTLM